LTPRRLLLAGAPLRPAWRRALWAIAFACGVLALTTLAKASQGAAGSTSVAARPDRSLVPEGRSLFVASCATCHGVQAQGIRGRAPSLHGVGALAADFYLETGRMPLPTSRAEPERTRPAFPPQQIHALVAYVASLGGPAIPHVRLERRLLSHGEELFAVNCSGCHTIQAVGGIVTGAVAPTLERATPTQIAEAIRIGPYVMPKFGPKQLSDADIAAIATFVEETNHHPANEGGWDIGRIGPISEGMVAWLLGIVALLIIARLLGERIADGEEPG
jgi:ubiquinol-cytochrome c reductase cytochrome c subunit